MALFGFGKKGEAPPVSGAARLPVEMVMRMKQQGFSNNQIVQSLQGEGYSTTQIFDALSQAELSRGAPASPAEQYPQPEMQQEELPPPEGYAAQQPMPPPEEYPMPRPQYSYPSPKAEIPREQIEEVAEAIVEEKWEELSKGVQKIISWKNETEAKIAQLTGEIEALKKDFDDLHKGVLGKLSEYDEGIKGVGTDIKAMEEVFKKIIPTFTENVSELSRITRTIKAKK